MAQPSPLDPAMPPRESLESVAFELARASGALSILPEATSRAVREMVRIVETHHSLSIDGHRVHPVHIEQAVRGELHDDAAVRGLQREAIAYLKAERFVASRVRGGNAADLSTPAFLKVLHWELYARIPEEFRWVNRGNVEGAGQRIVPGEFRSHDAAGPRAGAPATAVESLTQRFRGVYDLSRLTPVERIIAAAAAHHRLLWIRPFAGGNGRVARLFTAACLEYAGIEGALDGLWSMSRGLARARGHYRELLAAADARQRNDLDGREVLSPRGLVDFARFFLESCRDELTWMRAVLRVETLGDRIGQYVGLRAAAMAPGGPLHLASASLLRDVALRGEVPRGEAGRITGMATSDARRVLSALVKERLLISDTPKGPVRLSLPAHAAPFLFPDLYTGELVFRHEPRSVVEAA